MCAPTPPSNGSIKNTRCALLLVRHDFILFFFPLSFQTEEKSQSEVRATSVFLFILSLSLSSCPYTHSGAIPHFLSPLVSISIPRSRLILSLYFTGAVVNTNSGATPGSGVQLHTAPCSLHTHTHTHTQAELSRITAFVTHTHTYSHTV